MATILFSIFFGIGWILAILTAMNDLRILRRGRIEEDSPTEELMGIATRPGFVRLVAALRLVFCVAWIVVVAALAIRLWLA